MKWIGKVPERVNSLEREEIINYFGYIFEYSFDKDNTKGTTPKKIVSNIYLKLSHITENDKLWCAIVLLLLKHIAEINQYQYTMVVVDKIIENIDKISVPELEDYMNRINEGIVSDGVPGLIVRPFEIVNICGREVAEYNGYMPYIEEKEKILNIMYKYFNEKNVNFQYMDKVMLFDKKSSLKYADIITQCTELLISYFRMAYYNINADEKYKNISKDKKVEPLITAFCRSIFKNKKIEHDFINSLTSCLVDIVNE